MSDPHGKFTVIIAYYSTISLPSTAIIHEIYFRIVGKIPITDYPEHCQLKLDIRIRLTAETLIRPIAGGLLGDCQLCSDIIFVLTA